MNVDLIVTDKMKACLICSGEAFPAAVVAVTYCHQARRFTFAYAGEGDAPYTTEHPLEDGYGEVLQHIDTVIVSRINPAQSEFVPVEDAVLEEFIVPLRHVNMVEEEKRSIK